MLGSMETLGQIGEFTVKLVDGAALRNKDPDFHGYGHHYLDGNIPEKEIWLDATVDHRELLFFLIRALFEYAKYEAGVPNHEIALQGLALDRSIRQEQPAKRMKVRHLSTFGGLDVWLVDGAEVRRVFYPDFIQGGNGYRYEFIPKNEIWIEESLPAEDRVFTLLHELYETMLMSGGMTYDPAHERATDMEKRLRALVSEGQR